MGGEDDDEEQFTESGIFEDVSSLEHSLLLAAADDVDATGQPTAVASNSGDVTSEGRRLNENAGTQTSLAALDTERYEGEIRDLQHQIDRLTKQVQTG